MAFYQCIKLGGGTGDVADVEVNGTSVVDPISKVAEITSYEEVTLSEYEAIPVAERESNGVAYFIKDLNNESVQGYPPLIYSTDEREVGVWIDGKPLYQRSISIANTSVPRNGTVTIYTQTSIDLKYASGYLSEENLIYILPEAGVRITQSDDDIKISATSGGQWDITDGYVTIQYTKTTDVAGSGTWNGQGGIAHHYSTNETVIGTWIDGKPIYQRVITGLSIGQSSGTSYTIPIPSPDLEQIIDSTLMSTLTQYKTTTHPPTWISNSSNLAIRSQEGDTYDTFIIAYTKTTD